MPEPATTFGVAATIAILYQLNKSSRDPNMAIQRALFSLAPDGEEEVRAAKQAAENGKSTAFRPTLCLHLGNNLGNCSRS